MERVKIADVELEYEIAGSGEPVVFIHGALIADAFRPTLREPILTSRYRMVSWHRRGHAGSSPVSGPVTIPQHSADCLGLLRHLGIARAHVVGHSYGGDIAIQMALDAPATVHSLALLEPAMFVGTSAPGYRAALEGARERYREAGGAVVLDEFLAARWPGYRQPLDAILPGAFDQGAADAGTFFEHELPGLFAWSFAEAEARRVTQPTLSILGGENAAPGTRFTEAHERVLAWFLDAEGTVLPGATHMLHNQDPAGVAAILADFWSRHPLEIP